MLLRCVFTTKCFPRVSNLSSLCISITFHICGRVSTFFLRLLFLVAPKILQKKRNSNVGCLLVVNTQTGRSVETKRELQ
ncbi:CLL_collapsed_G0053830.mRNA.1.CDS.1 [Saccharomyces cerevisiae]|nr:CEQ_1a_G0053140.mRNA.1.CDS.1 [Saccharomyces cerevisiae]CAI4800109.1 ALH_1c_G0053510.mRNA.1.CDS.1 [Saccharomyces cerevisiae]CAI4801614.1 CLN_G0053780.mRNA.1.CDS.1 [Saccharomyces cerevisiae]CAI4808143.1 ADQ_G0053250.mRNA.1.CDS.1 [Saccharomyces cerevisiae]CAI4816658.1 BHH_G0053450.mRNA.1.CDS.1 [Saccharomyces cerevisiae]